MTDNKEQEKEEKKSKGEQTLKLSDLKDFTVGEIVEKSKRIDQENLASESVLDKYIRQHRSQIEEAKNKGLENYIREERQKLAEEGQVQSSKKIKAVRSEQAEVAPISPVVSSQPEKEEPEKVGVTAEKDIEEETANSEKVKTEQVEAEKVEETEAEEAVVEAPKVEEKPVTESFDKVELAGQEEEKKPSAVLPVASVLATAEREAKAETEETQKTEKAPSEPVEETLVFDKVELAGVKTEERATKEVPQNAPQEFSQEVSKEAPKEISNESSDETSKEVASPVIPTVSPTPAPAPERTEAQTGTMSTSVFPTLSTEKPEVPAQEKKAEATVVPVPVSTAESAQTAPAVEVETNEQADEDKKNKKLPIIIGICAVVLIGAISIFAINNNTSNKNKPIQTASASSSEKSVLDSFNSAYKAFFVDGDQTQLKNAQFSKLDDLKAKLDKISNASDKKKAQAEYDELKAEITAIGTVNGLFEKPVIVDGKLDQSINVKAEAKVPTAPVTKNTTLNGLLTKAIELAKQKLEEANKTVSSSSSSASNVTAGQNATGNSTANGGEQASSDTTTAGGQSDVDSGTTTGATGNTGASDNSGLSADGVALDTGSARVQAQANVNFNDPAFVWGDGVKERVLNIARERGYISGNNFILVPVAIHTTSGKVAQGGPAGIVSGYYNLYKPDGTYLFSINCKTGYFVGNGAGHADDLDY